MKTLNVDGLLSQKQKKQIKPNQNSPVLPDYFSLKELEQLSSKHRKFIEDIFDWIEDCEVALDMTDFQDKDENLFFIEVDKDAIEGVTQFYYVTLGDEVNDGLSIPMNVNEMIQLMQGGICNGIKLYD